MMQDGRQHRLIAVTQDFEPRLEPGLPQSTLAELNAANIQLLYVRHVIPNETNATFYLLGLDGKLRTLP